MRVVLAAALASLFVACSGSSSPGSCVAGASVACTCTNGKTGAQVCASDGTLGACSCDSGSGTGGSGGGAAGATGSGGATASGGSTGTGGAKGTGGAVGSGGSGGGTTMSASGNFTVTYDGTITRMYSTCYVCQANFYPQLQNEGAIAIGVNAGRAGIDVEARTASSGGGYEVSVGVEESDPAIPAGIQGSYGTTPLWVPMTGSCVNFSQISLQHGGGMAGTLNCTLKGGSDTTPHTAVVQGSFQGMFAP